MRSLVQMHVRYVETEQHFLFNIHKYMYIFIDDYVPLFIFYCILLSIHIFIDVLR